MSKEVARFKRVLHVRAIERDITQTELAGRLREEGAIIGRISDMEAERDNALDDFCADRGKTVSPQELWLERQGIDLMERKLSSDRQELEACRGRIEETRAELVSRHQNVQLMERYVGKLKARSDKEAIDAEQKNLDDITSMRYRRNMRKEVSP
ncbi:MAG: flagellar export protein FliJ [Synergistaceae bacterium]|jgi:flagellar export protein FliJ|nr:flagellar export protein FliJ [Synergistaceae bacterium]